MTCFQFKTNIITIGCLGLFFQSGNAWSEQQATEVNDACILQQFAAAKNSTTVAEIRDFCSTAETQVLGLETLAGDHSEPNETLGVISNRIMTERNTQFSPYVLTPHKMNYILPAYTTSGINKQAYQSYNGYEDNLEDIEAKFQISFKVPLNSESILTEGDGLYLGFTLEAWWQIYAEGISKPFRETNYQPELFYLTPLSWQPFDGNTGLVLGIEHQSNGRAQGLSRSWNRAYANFLYEKNNFAFSLRPWLRFSEDKKTYEFDPKGDDNPDIADYMGHFELTMAYQWDNLELRFLGRENFSTHKGFTEIGFTFPLWGKLKGYATASNGYGESLIDYNFRQTRFGLGVALNDTL